MTESSNTERDLGTAIAAVRRGQDVTANDLANRLMPWLVDHDRQVAEKARRDALEEAAQVAMAVTVADLRGAWNLGPIGETRYEMKNRTAVAIRALIPAVTPESETNR